jgi:hypothetical protein
MAALHSHEDKSQRWLGRRKEKLDVAGTKFVFHYRTGIRYPAPAATHLSFFDTEGVAPTHLPSSAEDARRGDSSTGGGPFS